MSLFQRIKASFRALFPRRYRWPGLDISLPGGQHLHLVGSIHMGTRDMSPLPEGLIARLRHADALIVEADISGNESPFEGLAIPPPLNERLSASQLAELERLGLRGDYGIDYQLLNAARAQQLPIIELEGADSQIALLRQMPNDGLLLLEDTLTHWHTNARLLQTMVSWWLDSPPVVDRLALPATFSESLYDVLMHERNQAWCEKLHALPAGRYVVAVGALHLYGEGNLPSLLR
jgi:uncharacterized protein YbaP (TraB family)